MAFPVTPRANGAERMPESEDGQERGIRIKYLKINAEVLVPKADEKKSIGQASPRKHQRAQHRARKRREGCSHG